MSNLLNTPDDWQDYDGTSPPSYWDGDTYVMTAGPGGASLRLRYVGATPAGNSIAGTINGTGFDGTGHLNIVSAADVILATFPMDGADHEFDIDVDSAPRLVVAGSDSSSEPTTVYSGSVSVLPAAEPVIQVSYNCECEGDDPTRPMQTLAAMRRRMLVRCGFANNANNPPPGTKELFDQLLLDAQNFLFDQYSHFRTARFFRWPLLEGVRFYDLDANDDTCPKKLSAEHLIWVGITRMGDPDSLKGEQWEPLICGIRPEQYSGGPLQSWPTHYEIRQCIEVYPAPGPNAGYLRIKGHFGLAPFTADDHKTTLDPDLIFYHAAADYFTTGPRPDPNKARGFAGLERSRLRDLVASSHQTRRYFPGDAQLPTPAPPVLKGPYQSSGP